jgi:hypothetical protein
MISRNSFLSIGMRMPSSSESVPMKKKTSAHPHRRTPLNSSIGSGSQSPWSSVASPQVGTCPFLRCARASADHSQLSPTLRWAVYACSSVRCSNPARRSCARAQLDA